MTAWTSPSPRLEDAAFISCTGLVDDEVETPEDYRAMLTSAAARGLEMICANPDIVVQRGDRMIPCGGALARLYGDARRPLRSWPASPMRRSTSAASSSPGT